MGEVYGARDTKLGRAVAIKVLPEALAFDPERVARFEREAKVLASLNHPHIAALHGMEQSPSTGSGQGPVQCLIMELVEGETLAERLRRGALPVEEALRLAIQMADALEAAHEQGVVHRDLKPANVKVTPDEQVKVLDFGLARAMESAPAAANLTNSPTLSLVATQAGVILGTAAYMAPEQAKGLPADHRSDVFSFGGVLYEMLTGRQAFPGETAPEILASVLVREPDLTALPPNIHPRLTEVLRRCLDKQPKRRWQAIGDLRVELETIVAAPRVVPAVSAVVTLPQPMWRRAAAAVGAALAASVVTGALAVYVRPAPPPPGVTRFSIPLEGGERFPGSFRPNFALSPDGTQIAYAVGGVLFAAPFDGRGLRLTGDAVPMIEGIRRAPADVSGTGTAHFSSTNPTTALFSPDGRWVAYYSDSGGTGTIYVQPFPPTGATYQRTRNVATERRASTAGCVQ